MNQRNLDAVDEIYASDFVGHDPTMPDDTRGVEGAFHEKALFVEPTRWLLSSVAERNGFLHLGALVTCGKNALE